MVYLVLWETKRAGVPSTVASWRSGRNRNDWTLVVVGNPQSRKIWITYTFDFIIEDRGRGIEPRMARAL